MALQFRRGVINDLPDPSDAAIGEPLFTTDEGKLRIKKADGTYAVIGSGTSTGELDLSGIAAGSLVKVNTGQDGFVAAAGTDLPSHTQEISTVNGLQNALNAKAPVSHTHDPSNINQASATEGQVLAWNGSVWAPATPSETSGAAWGQISGQLSAQDDLFQALAAKVDLADLPQDGSGNLDIAQESTLQALAGRTLTAGTGLTGGGDLTADLTFAVNFGTTAGTAAAGNHTHAAETLTTTAATTGYLKWTWSGSGGSWAIADAVAAAPTFINGGNANADDPGS